jgi:hypothetical protein
MASFAAVTAATYEEKGSDVNVAAHLLVDVLAGGFDAAVVISNDSDLRWTPDQPVVSAQAAWIRAWWAARWCSSPVRLRRSWPWPARRRSSAATSRISARICGPRSISDSWMTSRLTMSAT